MRGGPGEDLGGGFIRFCSCKGFYAIRLARRKGAADLIASRIPPGRVERYWWAGVERLSSKHRNHKHRNHKHRNHKHRNHEHRNHEHRKHKHRNQSKTKSTEATDTEGTNTETTTTLEGRKKAGKEFNLKSVYSIQKIVKNEQK